MDDINQVKGVHGVGLAGSGGAAALVDAAHGATLVQDDGAAGESVFILGVADAQAGDVSDSVLEALSQ